MHIDNRYVKPEVGPPCRWQERGVGTVALHDLSDRALHGDREARAREPVAQFVGIEPIVNMEVPFMSRCAVLVKRAVLGLEVDDTEVSAFSEHGGKSGEHGPKLGYVVQCHHRDDEIELILGRRLGCEVKPHTRVVSGSAPASTLACATWRMPSDGSARVICPTECASCSETKPVRRRTRRPASCDRAARPWRWPRRPRGPARSCPGRPRWRPGHQRNCVALKRPPG